MPINYNIYGEDMRMRVCCAAGPRCRVVLCALTPMPICVCVCVCVCACAGWLCSTEAYRLHVDTAAQAAAAESRRLMLQELATVIRFGSCDHDLQFAALGDVRWDVSNRIVCDARCKLCTRAIAVRVPYAIGCACRVVSVAVLCRMQLVVRVL